MTNANTAPDLSSGNVTGQRVTLDVTFPNLRVSEMLWPILERWVATLEDEVSGQARCTLEARSCRPGLDGPPAYEVRLRFDGTEVRARAHSQSCDLLLAVWTAFESLREELTVRACGVYSGPGRPSAFGSHQRQR